MQTFSWIFGLSESLTFKIFSRKHSPKSLPVDLINTDFAKQTIVKLEVILYEMKYMKLNIKSKQIGAETREPL
jgi:hypothetical protein